MRTFRISGLLLAAAMLFQTADPAALPEPDGGEPPLIIVRDSAEEDIHGEEIDVILTEEENMQRDGEPYVQEIPDDFIVPRIPGRRAQDVPDSYDARTQGLVSPVRDQRPWQLCWAFSALAAGESSLLSKGQADSEVDLSEMHLGYFFGGPARDPLGLSGEDSTTFLGESYLTSGNNNKFTTFALANWVGGAEESSYPYDPDCYDDRLGADDATAGSFHLKNALWISAQDTAEIKKAVMRYGAVGLSYYHREEYLNTETNAYYNPSYTTTNHAVTVVGWDDAYPKENFNSCPEGNGAWLIKNSLGTDSNDEGYFWLSYHDAAICTAGATAFVFEFEPALSAGHNYHYDGSYGTRTATVSDQGSIAAVFCCGASSDACDEALNAVGFAVADVNVGYSVQIYTELEDAANPTDGIPALSEPLTGQTTYCGYYTVPLPEPVRLIPGERFSVVVTLTEPGASEISFFVDRSYQNGAWISFSCEQKQGETFARSNGQAWQDLADQACTARIKAITGDLPTHTARDLFFPEPFVSVERGEDCTLQPQIRPSGADWPELIWSTEDERVATVLQDGTVHALMFGETRITVRSADGRLSASCLVCVPARVSGLSFDKVKIGMLTGESLALTVQIEPEEARPFVEISFSSSDDGVVRMNGAEAEAVGRGTARVTASCGSASAVCEIRVRESVNTAEISVEDQVYTGEALRPDVRVSLGGRTLLPAIDYTLSYRDNIGPGQATVTVSGIGDYTGQRSAVFQILEPPVENGWVKKDGLWYYYQDGVPQTGWRKISGTWYYLEESGAMATGWRKINGTWYYLEESGAMATGRRTIDGKSYSFADSGAWIP